ESGPPGLIENSAAEGDSALEESNIASGPVGRVVDGCRDRHRLSKLGWVGTGNEVRAGIVREVDVEHRMKFEAVWSYSGLSMNEIKEANTLDLHWNVGCLKHRRCCEVGIELCSGRGDCRSERTCGSYTSRRRNFRDDGVTAVVLNNN